jgi:uncharacterized protein with WD repeat
MPTEERKMTDKFDMQVGEFRALQIPGRAMIAFEPTGTNLATYKGDVLVIDLKHDTPADAVKAIADLLNAYGSKVSIKDLSKG